MKTKVAPQRTVITTYTIRADVVMEAVSFTPTTAKGIRALFFPHRR
jgi:hypothetical protein